jgi:hypothetical protein
MKQLLSIFEILVKLAILASIRVWQVFYLGEGN